jgi:hypothetical protein
VVLLAATIKIVKRSEVGKFGVLPKRGIVGRTFAWLALSRRLDRDDEINPKFQSFFAPQFVCAPCYYWFSVLFGCFSAC